MKNFYAVIMAGGQGTRLWPLSRKNNPKQLHKLSGEKPMLRETFERLLAKFKTEEIIISTTPEFADRMKVLLPELPDENFIIEPFPMNTAAACGLVSKILSLRDSNSTVVFLPSDHDIKNPEEFLKILTVAEKTVDEKPDHLVLIGMKPDKPDINLGYIEQGKEIIKQNGQSVYEVQRFVEKPDLETAQAYLKAGNYLWNAGMFTWKTRHVLELIKENLPNTFSALEEIGKHYGKEDYEKVLEKEYAKVEDTSVDYGILEKTEYLLVIPAEFSWSDIGSWGTLLEMLTELKDTDIISEGHHISIDDSNVYVSANHKLIATVGLKDIVVVDTPDATLICNSNESHKVKDILSQLKENGKEQYL